MKKMIKGTLIAAGTAAVLSAVGMGGLGYVLCQRFLKRHRDIYQDDALADEGYTGKFGKEYASGVRWNKNAPVRDVTLTARDGVKLVGSFLPAAGKTRRAVLLVHGYHSTWQKDFAGIVKYYHEHGADVLCIEQRAHRRSGGIYITMGILESEDVAEWAAYLAQREEKEVPIYLHGMSMGGASVLMAQAERLPAQVAGIIDDCGFTSPWDINRACMKAWFHLPTYPVMPCMRAVARLVCGYDMKAKSTIEILRRARIPTLFIHGTKDDFVPPHMTIHNYQACAAKKWLCLVDEASHAMSWYYDNAKYILALESFFKELEQG